MDDLHFTYRIPDQHIQPDLHFKQKGQNSNKGFDHNFNGSCIKPNCKINMYTAQLYVLRLTEAKFLSENDVILIIEKILQPGKFLLIFII